MPATLSVTDLVVVRGADPVLDHVELLVAPGHRVGVVGPNGVGKSTLLAACAGKLPIDSGGVRLSPPTATIGWLGQEPERSDERVSELLSRRTGVAAAQVELEAATAGLALGDPHGADRYDVALQRWLSLGAADLDARIGVVAEQLGHVRADSGAEDVDAVGWRGGAGRVGGSAVVAVRRVPARRAHQRSRPRRIAPPRGLVARARRCRAAGQPRPPIPRSRDHRRRRDRRVHPSADRVRGWLAGIPRRA